MAEWAIVADSSSVTMYATKQGAWFDGRFEDFTASIEFDPALPEAGRIAGTVATASIETTDEQNTAYVMQYLEVNEHPEATFVSSSIRRENETYAADGVLTLLGNSRPVTLLFVFDQGGESTGPAQSARFTGRMIVDRFEFGVASDVDTTQAGREVTIQIELDLKRRDQATEPE